MKNIEAISHELENILDIGRQGSWVVDSNTVNGFLKGIDMIKEMLEFRQYSDEINAEALIQLLRSLIK